MSRKRNKGGQPSKPNVVGEHDELGEVMVEESGMPLAVIDAAQEPVLESHAVQPEDGDMQPVTIPRIKDPSTDTHGEASHESIQVSPDAFVGASEDYTRESWLRRIVPLIVGGLIVIALIISIGGFFFINQFLDASAQSQIVKKSFESIQQSVINLDFRTALAEFPKGALALDRLNATLVRASFFEAVPWLGPRITETHRAVLVLRDTFSAGQQLLSIVSDVGEVIFRRNKNQQFEFYMRSLSEDEKGTILDIVSKSLPTLKGVQATLLLSMHTIDSIDRSLLSAELDDALTKVRAGAQQIEALLAAWQPLAGVVPSFLGFPQEKTYLILFQDSSEVRATGGVISHYGILKLHNGEITYLKTDNVYNLDDKAESALATKPPRELSKLFSGSIKKWLLHDANWSPDFYVTAQQAEALYAQESGAGHIDGVLAATPELIKTLLLFSGPVRIEGRDYTANTFMQQLEFEVQEGNYRRGITDAKRKEIFGAMVSRIGDRLLTLPLTSWIDIYKSIETRLNEKQLLVYFHDQALQKFVHDHNWTGEIRPTNGDFLMVTDSIFGSLKTESVMDKQVRYSMHEDKDHFMVARVDLIYTNNGVQSDITTTYRDWVRVYVPKGSKLVSVQGIAPTHPNEKSAPLEITEKDGTIEFAGFFAIEPRHTETLSIEYVLPDHIYKSVRQGTYSLLLQKQPGSSNQHFEGALTFLHPIHSYSPTGFFNSTPSPTTLNLLSDFRTDQEFTITLEK